MRLRKLIFVFVVAFVSLVCQNAQCSSVASNLMDKLRFIHANRENGDFLSLILSIFGQPVKMFRHFGYDVWFYPKLSTSLTDEPLKNVYLFIEGGKIVSIETFNQNLNPYTDFETYP